MDPVDYLWEIVRDLAWTLPSAAEELVNDVAAFEIHGHKLGLSETLIVIFVMMRRYLSRNVL